MESVIPLPIVCFCGTSYMFVNNMFNRSISLLIYLRYNWLLPTVMDDDY